MTWTTDAFERLGDGPDADASLVGLADHLGRFRGEHEIHARQLERAKVALQIARVTRKVLAGPELGRVHEDGNHHESSTALRLQDEGQMAVVKRPHRRHEANTLSSRARGMARVACGGNGGDDAGGHRPTAKAIADSRASW